MKLGSAYRSPKRAWRRAAVITGVACVRRRTAPAGAAPAAWRWVPLPAAAPALQCPPMRTRLVVPGAAPAWSCAHAVRACGCPLPFHSPLLQPPTYPLPPSRMRLAILGAHEALQQRPRSPRFPPPPFPRSPPPFPPSLSLPSARAWSSSERRKRCSSGPHSPSCFLNDRSSPSLPSALATSGSSAGNRSLRHAEGRG